MASARSAVTMLTTNSPLARRLLSVSLVARSVARMLGQKSRVGGLEQTALKKEKGARLGCPAELMVETQAMGLGTTAPVSNLYRDF